MYAGIDLGASRLKITIIDFPKNGPDSTIELIEQSHADITTDYPHTGWAEQNPLQWREALKQAFDKLDKKNKNRIKAISFSGGAHIALLLDKNHKPLRPAILWSDQRAAPQAKRLHENHGQYIFHATGNRIQPTWSLASLAWIAENQPQLLEHCYVCFAKDYIRMCLGGAPVTDTSDAQGSMLWNINNGEWDKKLLSLAGLKKEQMPLVVTADTPARKIDSKADKEYGLPEKALLYCGAIDTTSELLPVGCIDPGDTSLKLATAGVWSRVIKKPAPSSPLSLYPGCAHNWYLASGCNNCAGVMHWATHLWGCTIEQIDKIAGNIFADVKRAQKAPIFLPYLLGERAPLWNADIRAQFYNIDMAHNRDDFLYAVVEGVCFALRHTGESGDFISDKKVSLLGGLARLPRLTELLASVLSMPLKKFDQTDASYGSALMAAIASGAANMDNCTSQPHTSVNAQSALWLEQRYNSYLQRATSL